MTERVLVSVVVGARMTDGVRDSSIFEDSVGHERHLDAAADLLTALTGDTEVANRGKCTIANRLEKGYARKGVAFRVTLTRDAATCASYCADTIKGCVAINYKESDNICYFLAAPGYVYRTSGYTTALVNPSAKDVCSSANMALGHVIYGGDIPGNPRHVSSATECCFLCYATKQCIAYTFHTGSKTCWIKSQTPPSRTCSECMSGLVCLPASE